MLDLLLEALVDAVATVRRAGEEARENLIGAALDDVLVLILTVERDGGVFGEFFNDKVMACWDGCNGITSHHRAGWCPFNPEHCDMDCGCGEQDFDEDFLDEITAAVLDKIAVRQVHTFTDEEPF